MVWAVHPEADALLDELGDVGVHGDEVGLDSLPGGLGSERAHEVVCLVVVLLDHRYAERLDHLAAALELAVELLALVVGHRDARRLVGLGDLVAERDRALVERDDDVRGFEFGEHREEGVGEAEGGADEFAGGADAEGFRQLLHGVVGAVDDGVPVDDDEARGAGPGGHVGIIREWTVDSG